jgi:hypothetical protein
MFLAWRFSSTEVMASSTTREKREEKCKRLGEEEQCGRLETIQLIAILVLHIAQVYSLSKTAPSFYSDLVFTLVLLGIIFPYPHLYF